MVTNRANKSDGSRRKKFQNMLRRLAPLTFLIRVQAFRDTLRGEFPHVQIFMNDGPNPLSETPSCSGIYLAEILRSSKISSWIWSITSGVVTVLGHPWRGATQVEKLPRLNWATKFLMVTYNSACSPNVFVSMAWISFSSLPCRKKKLMTARASILLKSRTSPEILPMFPFSL